MAVELARVRPLKLATPLTASEGEVAPAVVYPTVDVAASTAVVATTFGFSSRLRPRKQLLPALLLLLSLCARKLMALGNFCEGGAVAAGAAVIPPAAAVATGVKA